MLAPEDWHNVSDVQLWVFSPGHLRVVGLVYKTSNVQIILHIVSI